MRRLAMGLVVLAGLSLCVGCSSSDSPSGCGPGQPTVSGKPGTDPVITIPDGKPSDGLVVCQLGAGTGQAVKASDYVLVNVEGKVWQGNRSVVDSYTNRAPQGLPLSTAMPAWQHLAGSRVGSRVMMVVPPKDGFGSSGNPAASVTATDTLVFVFDVLQAVAPTAAADGTPQPYHPAADQPSVKDGPHGPEITVPTKSKPPDKLTTAILRRGSGPPILSGQTVVTQYSGVVWRTGKQFDSSWQHGVPQTFVLGAGQVLPGWEQGLGGLPVGSRVLLTVPPALGYGQAGKPPAVEGNDTLVFVIDIVAAVSGG
jgi:peptidylprolyl isomerase